MVNMREIRGGATPDELIVDLSGVGESRLRHVLEIVIAATGCTTVRHEDFWGRFQAAPERLPERMIVVADLAELVKSYRCASVHEWTASIRQSKPVFVTWLRTKRDWKCASEIDEIAKHSDARLFVCRRMAKSHVQKCLSDAIASTDPRTILEIRFDDRANTYWVAFSDGLTGSFRLDELGLSSSRLRALDLPSAVVEDGGFAVQLLKRDGDIFDIDSESIRALLDTHHADQLTERSGQSVAHAKSQTSPASSGWSIANTQACSRPKSWCNRFRGVRPTGTTTTPSFPTSASVLAKASRSHLGRCRSISHRYALRSRSQSLIRSSTK